MRSPAKTLYVLLMTSILITGCLNSGSTADSATTTNTPENGPVIHAEILSIETVMDSNGELVSIEVEVYHAMIDWGGTIEEAGWDTDLDGVIDYFVAHSARANGITTVSIDEDDTVESDDGVMFTIAFGAKDNDGNWGTVMLTSYSDVSFGPGHTQNSYTADDAAAGITNTDNDTLIQIRWQYAEDDLNWAFVIIKLTVGDNTYDCGIDGTDDCAIAQDGDDAGLWQTGEFLTLSENAADICGGNGEVTCVVSIHVTYRGTVVAGTSDLSLS